MSYEEQLSAARFKAERDQARQEVEQLNDKVDELCEYIGVNHEDCDGEKEMLEKAYKLLDKRLMPEGYEWPRYEDGSAVDVDDKVVDIDGLTVNVDSIEFHANGFTLHDKCGDSWWYEDDDTFKRPAALAADGESLEVGQTVWCVDDGREFYVYDIDPKWGVGVSWQDDGSEATGSINPAHLTHQRPVLDANGVPIKAGDTVWCLATDYELADMNIGCEILSKMHRKLTVKRFIDNSDGSQWANFEETPFYVKTCYLTHTKPVQGVDGLLLKLGDTVYNDVTGKEYRIEGFADAVLDVNVSTGDGADTWVCHDVLTHTKPEPPDSWERLEEDARQLDIDLNDTTDDYPRMSCCCDLVRRAMALAGVSE